MDDVDTMHYALNKAVCEHKDLRKFTADLRSLLLETIMAMDEEQASIAMEKFTKLKEKHPCSNWLP